MAFESMYQKMTIRVPDDLRDTIQKNADEVGMTMSDYAREMIEKGLESGPKIKKLEQQRDFVIDTMNSVLCAYKKDEALNTKILKDCINLLETGHSEKGVQWVIDALKTIAKYQIDNDLNPPGEPSLTELMEIYRE